MSTALITREDSALALPKEQIDLITRTVAAGATKDELALFLYDCQRRGVHPLDKLLHFTKRGGKYTPVTSIDFMRAQAAMSGEMAGSDDPVFAEVDSKLQAATVTVYRITHGQRFPYTATARWAEYCPDNAPMWKRMPHTMLGKCAEALALRKAFPQQLAGLYSREEMDQAERTGYVVEAPAAAPKPVAQVKAELVKELEAAGLPVERAKVGLVSEPAAATDADDLPPGAFKIKMVETKPTRNQNVTQTLITMHTGETFATIRPQLAALAEQCLQEGVPVYIESKQTKWGHDLLSLHRCTMTKPEIDATAWKPAPEPEQLPPLTDADIPFAWLLPLMVPAIGLIGAMLA